MAYKYIEPEVFNLWVKTHNSGDKKYDEEIAKMFLFMASGIINGMYFQVEKEDAMQDCLVRCWLSLDKCDTTNGSAFSYFTTVIMNHIRGIWRKNRDYSNFIQKYMRTKDDGLHAHDSDL